MTPATSTDNMPGARCGARDEAARSRLAGGSRSWGRWSDLGALAIVLVVIGGPALFTRNGFSYDFTNHLWLVWVQEQAISHHLAPAYFVDAPKLGVFYPFFAFYGGTLYAASGALAALLGGHVDVAYVCTILFAIAAAYGGLLWLARQLGARGWMAHAPALTFVASAYYVTNLYGRGAWTEAIATSTIPLLLASGLKLARSERVELLPATLFVISAIFFAGSHNVTLLLGTAVIVVLLVLLCLALGRDLVRLRLRRVIQIGGLFVLAIAVDAWFLLPDAVHASATQIGALPLIPWSETGAFNTPGMLFDPLRAVPSQSTTPALYVQAPDWFLAWALAALVVLSLRVPKPLKRAAAALAVLLACLLALIMIRPLWDAMPHTFREVQLPFRLNTYVALCSAGLVLVAAIAVQRAASVRVRRALNGTLAGVIAISAALCAWQLFIPNTREALSYSNRSGVFVSTHATPQTWYDFSDYADHSEPVITTSLPVVSIDPGLVIGNSVKLAITPPAGQTLFATNIAGGPYVVGLGNAVERVGRTSLGLAVLKRTRPGRGPVALSISPQGRSIAVGRILSLVAVLSLLGLLSFAVTKRIARNPLRLLRRNG